MIAADEFLGPARDAGFDFYTGVPCSFLTPIINRVISDDAYDYVGAASEGEAVAIAAGAWLAGRGSAVMMQNSGLGNAVNPLTSLNYPFRIPAMMIVTWRGGPGLSDEPQHELMGGITPDLLDVIQVSKGDFPTRKEDVSAALGSAVATMNENGLPYAFIMQKGTMADEVLTAEAPSGQSGGYYEDRSSQGVPPTRYAALERLLGVLPHDAAVIATTGKSGRELFTIDDRPQHFYQVGSMGCAAAMGLGVALNRTRPVVVIDGDGAALMKLGSLATVGAYGAENLVHIVLDNGTYDSTGGQPTTSGGVNFAAVAAACGYVRSVTCDELSTFDAAVENALRLPGPHLVHMRIQPGSMKNLGRPNVPPHEVAQRFKTFLASG